MSGTIKRTESTQLIYKSSGTHARAHARASHTCSSLFCIPHWPWCSITADNTIATTL